MTMIMTSNEEKQMDVKDKLKDLRTSQGMSMAQAAEAAGISAPLIHRIETGAVQNPGVLTIRKLAKVYGTTLDELFDDSSISLKNSLNEYMDDDKTVSVNQWTTIKKVLDLVLKED